MVAEPMGAFRQTSDAADRQPADAATPYRHRWDGGPAQTSPAESEAGIARDRIAPPRSVSPRSGRRVATVPAQRLTLLTQAIETEIVPRLVLAGRITSAQATEAMAEAPAADTPDVLALTDLVLASDVAAATAFCEALHDGGMPLEVLYLDLLAPTARRLGQMWTDDTCTFTDVTLGLQQLRAMLRRYSGEFASQPVGPSGGPRVPCRRALLVPAPGEQHGFGLAMVSEFFRHAGWDVWSGPIASRAELVGMVSREAFSILGYSVSCYGSLDALASSIRAVRRASHNPAIGIMVGGPAFIGHPELAALVGADATAADGRQATLQAESLLTLLTSRAEK